MEGIMNQYGFKSRNTYVSLVMWALPLSFFTFQFLLRLWPGLTMQDIMAQFSIDAASFGLIAAFYYYGYAGMQIPVALLLDKFGARFIVFAFAMLCGIGTLLFIGTNNFYWALLGRFLIGVGSAAGFLGVSKVVSEWFSHSQYSRMIGFSFSMGLLGAIYGGKPLAHLIQSFNGKQVGLALAVFSILLGCCALLILRSPPNNTRSVTKTINLSHCSFLFSSWIIWALALANLLMVGALEGFADVWGVPYLIAKYALNKTDAAFLISFIFMGMIFGGPLLAFLSQKLGNYFVIALCGAGLAFLFLILLYSSTPHWWQLGTLFFAIGLLCCYQVVVFAAGSALVPYEYLGVTIAFLNCINMLGGSFFHTLIGKLMNSNWGGQMSANGLKLYEIESYQWALSLIPFCALCGSLLIILIHIKARAYPAPEFMKKTSLTGV
ncbi:TPA: MFS transporter [Legionella pneumophila]|uniref:Lysosomal dipeptide transporter MFSD1 n=2 Tax=Legionella pneumophila TaxID=446 RepID=A0A2S6F4A8_LEGPN|nr:MFS transporter [Legionella pneumophila]TIG99884.1 MFS transporter [Legionella pneumophila]HAT6902795.1 MFS transporter [Legionella pneumophila]HAT6924193.1 MFS transporter [Legionella pneumophila]HAT6931848.1 MFS transporter [Legionella pneumophila]